MSFWTCNYVESCQQRRGATREIYASQSGRLRRHRWQFGSVGCRNGKNIGWNPYEGDKEKIDQIFTSDDFIFHGIFSF